MARDWFGLDTPAIMDPSFLALRPSVRANYLTLFGLCAMQENGGLIPNPRPGSRPAWEVLGVRPGALRELEASGLAKQEDGGLRVARYDIERERSFKAARVRGKNAAARRWDSGASGDSPGGTTAGSPGGNAAGTPKGNATAGTTGNASGGPGGIAEEIREEQKDPPGPPAGGTSLLDGLPPGFVGFWDALPVWLRQRRDPALRAWRRQGIEEAPEIQTQIQAAVRWQRASDSWRRENEHHITARTYLAQRRWTDSPPHVAQVRPTAPRPPEPDRSDDDLRREWEANQEFSGLPYPGREEAWKRLSAQVKGRQP